MAARSKRTPTRRAKGRASTKKKAARGAEPSRRTSRRARTVRADRATARTPSQRRGPRASTDAPRSKTGPRAPVVPTTTSPTPHEGAATPPPPVRERTPASPTGDVPGSAPRPTEWQPREGGGDTGAAGP